jgi:hypothetical protein
MAEMELYRNLSEDVILAAERYVRELTAHGDLASPRVRRRLRIAVDELARIRQVFAADEGAELGELAFDVDDREQVPEPLETANQRMVRELVSMLPMILSAIAPRAPSVMAGVALGSAVGAAIAEPDPLPEDSP